MVDKAKKLDGLLDNKIEEKNVFLDRAKLDLRKAKLEIDRKEIKIEEGISRLKEDGIVLTKLPKEVEE